MRPDLIYPPAVRRVGPPVPAPAPPPSVNTTGNTPATPAGWNPKAGPLDQDPGYQAALNAQAAANANASAALASQRARLQYLFNGANNPYSSLALLKQQDADNTRAYLNSLAARGILQSGETGYQAGQESKRYGQAIYTAQQQLLDALNQAQQGYLDQVNTNQNMVNQALQQAWANYTANPDPNLWGTWNNGTLPGGSPGWVQITSPYQDPVNGGSAIVKYIK